MKYKIGDILYYVSPFLCIIEKVKIDMIYEETNGKIYYIDSSGAYLIEEDLFDNYQYAQVNALAKLEKIYDKVRYNILFVKPELNKE